MHQLTTSSKWAKAKTYLTESNIIKSDNITERVIFAKKFRASKSSAFYRMKLLNHSLCITYEFSMYLPPAPPAWILRLSGSRKYYRKFFQAGGARSVPEALLRRRAGGSFIVHTDCTYNNQSYVIRLRFYQHFRELKKLSRTLRYGRPHLKNTTLHK